MFGRRAEEVLREANRSLELRLDVTERALNAERQQTDALDRKLIAHQRDRQDMERQLADERKALVVMGKALDGWVRRYETERLKRRFAQQERDVFRRRWEKALRPRAAAATPAEKIEAEGRRLVAQAIQARTPAGDTQTAPLLQQYVDRRVADLIRERPDGLELRDWRAIADEILAGEQDDD